MRSQSTLQMLLLAVLSCCMWGHVYLFEPPSRNVLSHKEGTENCPHCLQANGPNAVRARGLGTWPTMDDPSSHGLCGDPVQNSAEPLGIADMKYMVAGTPQRTYVAGSIVEFKTGVSTHHWGHYEFRICDKPLDRNLKSAATGQKCLNSWVLKRAPRSPSCGNSYEGDCQRNNPRHPERWYLPPPNAGRQVAGENWDDKSAVPVEAGHEVHTMRFLIPSDLKCSHCTLQWYYATGNTCAYDADYFLHDPGFKFWNHYKAGWATCSNSCCGPQNSGQWAEEFWNCADVQVVSDDQPRPQPTLTTTAMATSLPSVSSTLVTTTTQQPSIATTPAPDASPVARHGRLATAGNRIVDEHGDVVQLRGMSLFWSQWNEGSKYYNREAVYWLQKDWSVSLIRVAMGVEMGGFLQNPDVETARVKTVVDAAIEFGIYVIIDWHDHNAEQHIPEAKMFFSNMASLYGKTANVIFETFNEPEHQSWTGVIKPYHEQLIPVIREYSDNLIILGTKTWSQDVDEASINPVVGANVAYTLHFYANTHSNWNRQKASTALANGIPLFVTEWGTCSADGNGEVNFASTQSWLDFLQENKISDANWAISDKVEKCAALRPGVNARGHWAVDELTDSGAFVRTSIRAFHHTSDSTPVTTTVSSSSTTTSEPEPEPEPSSTSSPSTIPLSTTVSSTSSTTMSESGPKPEPSSTITQSTSLPEPMTSTISSTTGTTTVHRDITITATTSLPLGTCDSACHDTKTTEECADADSHWQMCSGRHPWWHGQCKASCSKCESGLAPCTTPPPGTSPPPGRCDTTCQDSKSAMECRRADLDWQMCSSSNSWWHGKCQATCSKCESGFAPCTTSPPSGCDPLCKNSMKADSCKNADSAWGMCSGSDAWWKGQCAAFCKTCIGGLPPCAPLIEPFQQLKPKHFLERAETAVEHKHETHAVTIVKGRPDKLDVSGGFRHGNQALNWTLVFLVACWVL